MALIITEARNQNLLDKFVKPFLQHGELVPVNLVYGEFILLSNLHATVACYDTVLGRRFQGLHFDMRQFKETQTEARVLTRMSHSLLPKMILSRAISFQVFPERRYNHFVLLTVVIGMSSFCGLL